MKYIPDSDLKLLIDFLRLIVNSDLEFQAVYESVMSSFSVQSRLFKALIDRKDAFVDVRVKRKPRKILLKFSALPESLVSGGITELEENKKTDSVGTELLPLQAEKSESVALDAVQSEKIELLPLQVDNIESLPVKRKGRGKAKKQAPARSLVSVLIDDSDIELLGKLGNRKDMNLSQLIRVAARRLLQTGV